MVTERLPLGRPPNRRAVLGGQDHDVKELAARGLAVIGVARRILDREDERLDVLDACHPVRDVQISRDHLERVREGIVRAGAGECKKCPTRNDGAHPRSICHEVPPVDGWLLPNPEMPKARNCHVTHVSRFSYRPSLARSPGPPRRGPANPAGPRAGIAPPRATAW